MVQRGNTANYADAFVELYKIASMLDIWDKKREADILTAIMHDDFDKMNALGVQKDELLSLHSDIRSALKDAESPDGVLVAFDQIFSAPLAKVGVKMGMRKAAAKKPVTTTVEMLKDKQERPKEMTRPTETAKTTKPRPSAPFRRNNDYDVPTETSADYFAKLNLSSMPENSPSTGYEGIADLYAAKPNSDPNRGRFRDTQKAHREDGVLIVPAYMNNGIMYRDDMVHMILENIARRDTTGLSVYVGAVPLGKEELNNIGDLAMRMVMQDNDMVAKKMSGIIFSSLFKKASSLGSEELLLKKKAYNNHAFESHGQVDRSVIYPVRPESNILQYAHDAKIINIDSRSLGGVLMRADVKQKILRNLAVDRPLGKTADELKVTYVKMIESHGVYKALKFKKAVKELYDVDCGDIDDRILDIAHGKSVTLSEIENALFPTLEHQQSIDMDSATSNPTGGVSTAPVRLSFIDHSKLLDRYITAKKNEDKKEDDNLSEELKELIEHHSVGHDEIVDGDMEDIGSIIPEGIEVVEVGGPIANDNHNKNISINVSTNPDTGSVKVYLNGSLDKDFETMDEAIAWANKVSQIFNNVLDSSSDVVSEFKFSDISKLASEYNGFLSYLVKVATVSHNLREMLELYDAL